MPWYSINNIAFEVLGYPLSYIELTGTVFGLISVYLATRSNILTWPTGIINEIAFFGLFYQVQLYSDMYLQIYFLMVTLYGWYFWKRKSSPNQVYQLNSKERLLLLLLIVASTIVSGFFVERIHLWMPVLFPSPASYPYADAFTTICSIAATILLSRKRIETWILWIVVDIVAVTLYILKGIQLVAIEYVIFLILCISGFYRWKKLL